MSRLLIVSILILFTANSAISQNEKLVNEVLSQGLLASDVSNYRKILPLVSRGTKFERKWQINQPLKDGFLNLFVLKAGVTETTPPISGLRNLLNKCVQLGERNIVFCDDGFVGTFLARHKLRPPHELDAKEKAVYQPSQDAFITWVLGHEIGHILRGHGFAHFEDPGDMETLVETSTLQQREELEADAFVVGRVIKNRDASANLTSMVLGFLNAEIEEKIGAENIPMGVGILFDYRNQKVVEYLRRKKHPEYVIRLTRILQEIGRLGHDQGLKAMADAFAKHMRPTY